MIFICVFVGENVDKEKESSKPHGKTLLNNYMYVEY